MLSKSEGQTLCRETYPEPKTKTGVTALVREILDQEGAVERIVLERGQPVRAWRWREEEDLIENEQTLEGALRNSELIEYTNSGLDTTPFEIVFDMLQVIRDMEKSHPVCWATGLSTSALLLERWFQLPEHKKPYSLESMTLLPVHRLRSLPEDTLLLCGASFSDAEGKDVTVAIKTAIEIRRRNEQVIHRNADRSRTHPQERHPANGEVEDFRSRGVGQSWQPSSFIRARLGRIQKVR